MRFCISLLIQKFSPVFKNHLLQFVSQKRSLYALSLWILLFGGTLVSLDPYERRAAFHAMVEQDWQLIPPNLAAWINKQDISVEQFDKTVEKLNIEKFLSKVHQASKYVKKPATHGLLPEHVWKNVHIGCVPYDTTRSLRDLEGFYVSASDVLTPEQFYIVGEAPVDATEEIFWQAIIEADVRTIVALVTPSGSAYWDSNRFPKIIGRWKIEKKGEETISISPFFRDHSIVRRLFSIVDRKSDDRWNVTHFHYVNWPDHGPPESSLFHVFLDCIDAEHPGSRYPLFVHCAAGIGRSGTFVAAHSLRRDVLSHTAADGPLIINVAKRILELRMQRYRLLSRPSQLKAVIDAVRDAIHQKATDPPFYSSNH